MTQAGPSAALAVSVQSAQLSKAPSQPGTNWTLPGSLQPVTPAPGDTSISVVLLGCDHSATSLALPGTVWLCFRLQRSSVQGRSNRNPGLADPCGSLLAAPEKSAAPRTFPLVPAPQKSLNQSKILSSTSTPKSPHVLLKMVK